ncbi:MAG: hypothetical protein WC663_02080 [Patescibacteria group bacterium]|jgi:hypothetical protein
MTNPPQIEQEPQIDLEEEKMDITNDLRQELDEHREVSYENYGEKKIVSVKIGDKVYKFYPDNQEDADWVMVTEDKDGKYLDSIGINKKSDVEYLEKIFEQDIPDSLRQAIDDHREISYENYGEKKVIKIQQGDKTYKFFPDNQEHADWAMVTEDEDGKYLDSIGISEKSDVEYLEKIFEQDIPDGLRQALDEHREVSYENYGEKKIVSVKIGNKVYKFYPDNQEDADWVMVTEDKDGKYLDSIGIKEESDVEYLEKLFETPTKEEQIEEVKREL